ncbi:MULTISPECIES: DUF3710 domain-containing protein [Lawsonella]|jgi:hypothetical protein|uniref:DUF3710 domain-containing protein n=1 Tax=Lawsonella clevelandensis TaxID=1528099 RepID=A0A2W5IFT1_9ACTN|nr:MULTISPECIES: DUF3710 domain-containing protein [Lawsonella]PZP89883.1 MAG: DUF3710 domain-containing protein [Lawsonella clevelandensis]
MFGFGKKKKKAAQKKSAVAEETSVKNASAEGTRDTSENSVDSVVTSTASSSNTGSQVPPQEGPFDESDGTITGLLDPDGEGLGILDFGAYAFVPPVNTQLQIESSEEQNLVVHVLSGQSNITIDAYAAPKTGGQWRFVASELADGLRNQGAKVSIQDGPWGREVIGSAAESVIRFIGVDGPRWMLRAVIVSSPAEAEQSAEIARTMLSHTVVRRGTNPMPARTPIPLVLPMEILEQIQAEQLRQQEDTKLAAEQARKRDAADNGEALQQFDQSES